MSRRSSLVVLALLAATSCGVPSESRWDRQVGIDAAAPNDSSAGLGGVVLVEVGPIVAAAEFTGVVRAGAADVVVAPRPGRVESRSTAVGDPIDMGDLVIELGAAADPADALRLEILLRERDLAELLDDVAEIERLDAEIAAAQAPIDVSLTPVPSDSAGVISEYFVSVFDVVAAGDALFAVGDAESAVVVVDVPATEAADVASGTEVSVVRRSPGVPEPVAALVFGVENVDGGDEVRRVTVEAPDSVEVGDTVIVVFESASAATALRVDEAAVRSSGRDPHVIVVRENGEWERVSVSIGAQTNRFAEITGSSALLVEGDRLVLP